MPVWYALLDGSQDDVGHVKRLLTRSNFTFDQIDGKFALSAPDFQQSNDREQVIAASTELLAAINTSLRLSVKAYAGFELHGVAEKRDDGVVLRTMIAVGASYNLSGGNAVAIISGVAAYGMAGTIGSPVRSREERLVSQIQRNTAIAKIAAAMAARPLTWAAMNKTYESAKGLMSARASLKAKRADHQGLIDRNWISAEQSDSFYSTAGYHRHGYPKTFEEDVREMPYEEASRIITELFWRLIDELEPH